MRLLAGILLASVVWAGTPDAKVLEHHGRWESGYGAKFYNVVGRLQNTSDHALRFVKLRVDALDAHGKVVATTETYNESAEALAVPDLDPKELLASGKARPVPKFSSCNAPNGEAAASIR